MKKILMIGTGGTIAACPTEHGLTPALNSADLLSAFPDLPSVCTVDSVQLFSLDSTNIRPEHWLAIAEMVRESYDRYDGFVIAHGTDTMAYTAGGLSYLIQNSERPIVLTGAQRSIVEDSTDAKQNLIDAIVYACDEGSHGVRIVFSGAVICGTRARKNFTKRFMAFGSVNFPELARIQDGRILRYVPEQHQGDVVFYSQIDPDVGLLKLTPGMKEQMLRYAFSLYDGLVIESFGVGGLPEHADYHDQIKEAVRCGKTVVMTTQVPNEGSDLLRYRVGNLLKDSAEILEAYDMTSEAVLAKLMWILGITRDPRQVRELFYRPVDRDILYVR